MSTGIFVWYHSFIYSAKMTKQVKSSYYRQMRGDTVRLTRMWCGRNRNCRFKLDFSIRSLSVITSCSHKQCIHQAYTDRRQSVAWC